jgi:TonB family protein
MTSKDPDAVSKTGSGAPKLNRSGAVGAEIPVTVHASRATQAFGENLPPVHEETKTVIVLQQGAVVRLTATLTAGETVVLTNRMTGADVLCRVGNIKSQPGLQHYVSLEFIQQTPAFWGDTVAASNAPIGGGVSSVVPVPPAPATRIATPMTEQRPVVAPASVPSPASVAVSPTASVTSPLAPSPVRPQVTGVSSTLPQPVTVPQTHSQPTRSGSSTPLGGGRNDPTFDPIGTHGASRSSSGSRRALLVVAALMLLASGLAGGYWFYGGQLLDTAMPMSTMAIRFSPPTAPVDFASANSPAGESTLDSALAEAETTSGAQTDVVVESHPTTESSAPRVPLADRAGGVQRNVLIGRLKAPQAKTKAVRLDSSEPPPAMVGDLNLSEPLANNSLLSASSSGPAPPPHFAGGQLRPPQAVNSPPPVYPSVARTLRVEGVVVLDAQVNEDGNVVATTVISGPPLLAEAAQEAVQHWKYRPASLNGKVIAAHTRVSMRFNLQ